MFPLFGQGADGRIGEFLPTLALVRTGLMGTDGQRGIEQEYSLTGPTGKVPAGRNKHLVLASAHPSPLSAYNGFFGNKHFSRANAYLMEHGEKPINW